MTGALTESQRDGRSCRRCDGCDGAMVPAGLLNGVQTFVHEPCGAEARARADAAKRLRDLAGMLDDGIDTDAAILALDFVRIVLAEHETPMEPGDLDAGRML